MNRIITNYIGGWGEPVNKYRHEYKDLGKLRQLFFERVENTPSVDKYIKYYKWLDSSVNEFIKQLIPATSEVSEVRNVVESHILERNKYVHKFPSLETKVPVYEGSIFAINEMLYPWKEGHAPTPPSTAFRINTSLRIWICEETARR